MRRWKLSPMDLESITRWEEYSRAKDDMMILTDADPAPWYVVESDDKRRARINMIDHLLSTVPYTTIPPPPLQLPHRPPTTGYRRPPKDTQTYVPDHAADVEKAAKVFVTNELEPVQAVFSEINDVLGEEVIRFREYSLEASAV